MNPTKSRILVVDDVVQNLQVVGTMVVEDAQELKHSPPPGALAAAPRSGEACLAERGRDFEEHGRKILDTAARMAEMVQNLLDANRIERGEMQVNLAPTDLAAVLCAVVETQRPRATAKQQAIHTENEPGPVSVLVDPTILVQVLENLLSNAVKYSPAGKSISVQLRRESGGACCEVRDEGPGLSADDQKKLFGKFARLSACSQTSAGF